MRMNFVLTALLALGSGLGASSLAQAQAAVQAPPLVTTEVLAIMSVKPGITHKEIQKVMPEEVRAAVRLYLEGKIEQWYGRGDGKGVVFILHWKDAAEANALLEALPLAKAGLMTHELIPLGPLTPLRALIGPVAATTAKVAP